MRELPGGTEAAAAASVADLADDQLHGNDARRLALDEVMLRSLQHRGETQAFSRLRSRDVPTGKRQSSRFLNEIGS